MNDSEYAKVRAKSIEEIRSGLRRLNLTIPSTLRRSEMVIDHSAERSGAEESPAQSRSVYETPPNTERRPRISAVSGRRLSLRKMSSRQQSPLRSNAQWHSGCALATIACAVVVVLCIAIIANFLLFR